MPTYITLINWTGEGVKKVKDSPKRLEAAKKLFKAAGGNLKNFYLVMGQYDIVVRPRVKRLSQVKHQAHRIASRLAPGRNRS